MATAKTIYVDPDASGSADGTSWTDAYTSFQTAQNTEAADITGTAGDYLFLCRASGGTADTTNIVMSASWVTDATHRVIWRANTGDEAQKDTGLDNTRYRSAVTDAANIQTAFPHTGIDMLIDGIQFSCDGYSGDDQGAILCRNSSNSLNIDVANCFIQENNSDAGNFCDGIQVYATQNCTINVWNTIFVGFDNNVSGAVTIYDAGDTINLYNCIMYNCNEGALEDNGTLNAYYCASFNNTDDFQVSNGTVDYCASDDGDGTNSINASGGNWDNEYNDPANNDFTLLNTGNCYHGGSTDQSGGLCTTDMEGDTYDASNRSVGVDEISAVVITTGFDIRFVFSNVTKLTAVAVNAYYDGASSHYAQVQLYNNNSSEWNTLKIYENGSSFDYRYSDFPGQSSDYVNGSNQVNLRFNHPENGSSDHNMYIDYVAIKE